MTYFVICTTMVSRLMKRWLLQVKKNEERHRSLNELILLRIKIRERKKIRKKERKEQIKSTFFYCGYFVIQAWNENVLDYFAWATTTEGDSQPLYKLGPFDRIWLVDLNYSCNICTLQSHRKFNQFKKTGVDIKKRLIFWDTLK